jgi:hypothetical protein
VTVNLAQAGRRDEARAYGERFMALAPPELRRDVARGAETAGAVSASRRSARAEGSSGASATTRSA